MKYFKESLDYNTKVETDWQNITKQEHLDIHNTNHSSIK